MQRGDAEEPDSVSADGTIWRWTRPLVGFEADGRPHLRIEHRVVPAGPSVLDSVANAAGSQFMILSLILLRQSFKEITGFDEPLLWEQVAVSVP